MILILLYKSPLANKTQSLKYKKVLSNGFTTSILMVHERIKRVITAKKETFKITKISISFTKTHILVNYILIFRLIKSLFLLVYQSTVLLGQKNTLPNNCLPFVIIFSSSKNTKFENIKMSCFKIIHN
jgi:hypothetical protein